MDAQQQNVGALKRSLRAVLAQLRLKDTDIPLGLWRDLKQKTLLCLDTADTQTVRSSFCALNKSKLSISDDEWKQFISAAQHKLVGKGRADILETFQEIFGISSADSEDKVQSKRKLPPVSNVVLKRPRRIDPGAGTSSIVSKTASEGNVHFVDAFYLLKTNGISDQRHAISLDEIVTAGAELVVICNYKLDIPWMWNKAPGLQTSRKILIVHGGTDDEEQEWRTFFSQEGASDRVRFSRPSTPPYGTMHAKLFLLFFPTGCRVCVHTANMLSCDWDFKTQGAYVRDFPVLDQKNLQSNDESVKDDFKLELERYMQFSLIGSTMNTVVDRIGCYDFSSAGVTLVASVPGVHRGESKNSFGHARLRRILEKEKFPADRGDSVAVCQFSSLGSIQQKWLDQEFKDTLFAENRSSLSQDAGRDGEIKLVFPTLSQVQDSNEGLQAGASLPVRGKNLHRPHVTSKLHSWDGRISSREKAMPHIKTFLRYGTCSPESPFWVFLGSFNLSVAAWGRMQGGKKGSSSWDRLNILSFELGVLFSPSKVCPQVHAIDSSIKYHIPCQIEKKVWASARQSRNVSLRVSHFESEYAHNEIIGLEPQIVLRTPLPYKLPPPKYTTDDTPWTTELCCIA